MAQKSTKNPLSSADVERHIFMLAAFFFLRKKVALYFKHQKMTFSMIFMCHCDRKTLSTFGKKKKTVGLFIKKWLKIHQKKS